MQGFLLGLANGTTCLATCAPVLVPLFLGEGKRVGQNWALLAQFLAGRFLGYLLFGLLAWLTGQLVLRDPLTRGLVFGAAYILLAVVMLVYGLRTAAHPSPVQSPVPSHQSLIARLTCPISFKDARTWLRRWPALIPVGMGFFTGLNLCPPFLLAFAGAAYASSALGSLLYFSMFFLGTAVFFIPVPFLGVLKDRQSLQTVGKLAAVIMALYYVYLGAMEIVTAYVQM